MTGRLNKASEINCNSSRKNYERHALIGMQASDSVCGGTLTLPQVAFGEGQINVLKYY